MSELSQAIEQMRNMRESYNELAGAAEAYSTGKSELAANITAKGVPASASETLPELAEKVNAIAQESYTIDGGEMYAKQLYGSLTAPNYWNLYEVLMQLLSDGRLVNYGGILLAEYYKGYDSLALSGAGAGGAYVVSDKDAQGNFIMYTNDTTHTWDTAFDGKGNRWVAYCFADAGHNFDITDTNTSPRSIHIGRHVGTITSLVNGRVSEIVVTDGNILDGFNTGTYTQNWGKFMNIRNLVSVDGTLIYNSPSECVNVATKGGSGTICEWNFDAPLRAAIFHVENANNMAIFKNGQAKIIPISELYLDGLQSGTVKVAYEPNILGTTAKLNSLQSMIITNCEGGTIIYNHYPAAEYEPVNFIRLYIGYQTNNKSMPVVISGRGFNFVQDCSIRDVWCKPLDISSFIALTEANMYAHILQRLKQDEAGCGDGVTITLGATNLAKLTSQESQDLLASLRGTYGYTFA